MATAKVIDQDGQVLAERQRGDTVDPSLTHMLTLSDGKWVEIKKELNHRESVHVTTSGFKSMLRRPGEDRPADEPLEIKTDFESVKTELIATWTVSWNLVDPRGRELPLTRKSIDNLRASRAQEICDAIEEYAAEQKALEDALKNGTGARTPLQIIDG